MEGSMPPDNHEPGDITMTNAEDWADSIFDDFAEMDATWSEVNLQDPFMFPTEPNQDDYIDPVLFAQSLGLLGDYGPSSSASPSAIIRLQEPVDPFAVPSSPIRQAQPVTVSTPVRQRANSTTALSDYSPTSSGLYTPTRRDRGHYGSARRRTGTLSNFQTIAASSRSEVVQANTGYTFEPIDESQQGILSPSHYLNEDIPEFRPRRVIHESSHSYNNRFNFPEELDSPALLADPETFEGTAAGGGFDSQGTEPGATQEMAQIQDALQFPNQFPVVAPAPVIGITIPNSPTSYAPVVNVNGTIDSNTPQFPNYTSVAPPSTNGGTAPNVLPNYVPVIPPTTIVGANPIPTITNESTAPSTVAPWASGLDFSQELDPARRAKMQEIARVSHMLLTSKETVFAAKKSKVLQAGVAADKARKKKKPPKRARKNNKGQDNTVSNPSLEARPRNNTARSEKQVDANDVAQNANNTQNLVPPAAQPASINQPGSSKSSAKARGRKVSDPPNPTYEERIAQFWSGRRDKFGNELEPSFLCHGIMERYRPGPEIGNPAASESPSNRYTEGVPDDHSKLSEDTPELPPPHSEIMLYSEVMTEENFDAAVYSEQALIVSYDIKSDWWHEINIWAWSRDPMARDIREIAVVITPFHIIFARMGSAEDIATLKKDWISIMALIERTFQTPVVGAEEKTWAYMYRVLPISVTDQNNIAESRQWPSRSHLHLLNELGTDTAYNKMFHQFAFYVPANENFHATHGFGIRVGRFGLKGQEDRPRVEIRDLAGRRVV